MAKFLNDYEPKLGIKITCSQKTEPLSTACPLSLPKDKLIDESSSPFFIFNSDVICEFPFEKMTEFHKTHGGEASIMIEALKATGVGEVFVVINKEQEVMTTVLKDFETKLQIQITCLCETKALGSAGSLAFAKEKLMDGGPFFCA
ncbi:hypothetical protein Scep_021376 [Stephania cephalantha]|uniref:Nucleotidyl transferase domain-containing protein n=1 Tax=Stephania cephalantha TaxID=152367 RepID=A0AAP0I065_9MAGN